MTSSSAFTSVVQKITDLKKDEGRYLVPSIMPEPPKLTLKEEEAKADQRQIVQSEIARGGYNPAAIAKQKELEQKESLN